MITKIGEQYFVIQFIYLRVSEGGKLPWRSWLAILINFYEGFDQALCIIIRGF